MSNTAKFYIALGVAIVGSLLTLSSDFTILVIGFILSLAALPALYYYRAQRKVKVTQNELEINALIKAQEYKDSQKK